MLMPKQTGFSPGLRFVASFLAALLFFVAAIADSAPPPRLLPSDVIRSAKPMPPAQVPCEERMRLREAVAALNQGDPERATKLWRQVKLPKERELWRQFAITASLMRSGEFEQAEVSLKQAEQLGPESAVFHYLQGVWLTIQSAMARTSNGKDVIQQVADYDDAALTHFREVREVAHRIPWGARLGSATTIDDPGLPTVFDLLAALKMDRLVAKSHVGIAEIYKRRGLLDRAETNLDEAARLGLDVAAFMRDLANRYGEVGEHRKVARALIKSMRYQPGKAATILRLLQAIRAAVVDN